MTESREVAIKSGLKRELAKNMTQQKPRTEQQKFLRGREPGLSSLPARLKFEKELQLLWGQATWRGDPHI